MNLNELYNLDVSGIRKSAAKALSTGKIVDQTADYLRQDVKNLPKIWKGSDSDTAGVTLGQHAEQLETAGQAVRKAHKIFDQLAEALDREHKGVVAYVDAVNRQAQSGEDGWYSINIASGDVKGGPGTTDAGAEAVKNAYMDYVKRATVADTQAATAIAGIDELNKADEAANAYKDLNGNAWDADHEDSAEAGRLLGLANTRDLSKQELKRLRELVEENRVDKDFAQSLLAKLGARGFLSGYASVLAENREKLPGLHKDLSHLLATATADPGPGGAPNPVVAELVSLIPAGIDYDAKSFGTVAPTSTVLGPLLEHGNFTKSAIGPIADKIYDEFKLVPRHERFKLGNLADKFDDDRDGPRNPLDSALTALSNSDASRDPAEPDHTNASQDFLQRHPEALKFVLERTGQLGPNGDDDVPVKGVGPLDPVTVGGFLEAATTGVDKNDPDPSVPSERSPEAAKITNEVISFIGDNPEPYAKPTPELKSFRRSLTQIIEYSGRDFYLGFRRPNPHNDPNITAFGTPLNLPPALGDSGTDRPAHYRFLELAGVDKESRLQLQGAFDRLAREDLHLEAKTNKDITKTYATDTLRTHARLTGTLARGLLTAKQNQVEQANLSDQDAAYWVKYGAGFAVGVAGGFAAAALFPATAVTAGVLFSAGFGSVGSDLTGKFIDSLFQEGIDKRNTKLATETWDHLKQARPKVSGTYDEIIQHVREDSGVPDRGQHNYGKPDGTKREKFHYFELIRDLVEEWDTNFNSDGEQFTRKFAK